MAGLNFLESDLTEIRREMKSDFEAAFGKTMYEGSTEALLIDWLAYWIWHGNCSANEYARQNLPEYATGENLDALLTGMFGIERQSEKAAETTICFYGEKGSKTKIPAGTLVSADGELYFETKETVVTEDGVSLNFGDINFAKAEAVCTVLGEKGNGIAEGTEFVCEAEGVTKAVSTRESAGGLDEETDEEYYRRYLEESKGFSASGASNLYEYLAKKASDKVIDAFAASIEEDEEYAQFKELGYNVIVRIIADGDDDTNASVENCVLKYINESDLKPQGDCILAVCAEVKEYELTGTYQMSKEDMRNDSEIAEAIDEAVGKFREYTESKMGRMLNPTKLIALLHDAGASFVNIETPNDVCGLKRWQRWRLKGEAKLTRQGDLDE